MYIQCSPSLLEELLKYGASKLPCEACGVIIGSIEGEQISAVRFAPLSNHAKKPEREFAFPPEQWIALSYKLLQQQLQIVGLFHSHPTEPPAPSPADLSGGGSLFPSFWIISYLHRELPELQAYCLSAGKPQPLAIRQQPLI